MLLNINRCLKGGRGGECRRLPHSRWCVCLSVCLQLWPHLLQFWALCLSICICVSASSFFSNPLCQWREAEEWSVRLWCRWPLPWLSTAHEARQLQKPPEAKLYDGPVWSRKFDEISVHLMSNHYSHLDPLELTLSLLHPARCLDTVSHMWQTGSARVWRGISDGEGGKMTVASFSAIFRQDSPEEVRNQHPTWSMLPVLNEYRSGYFCKLIRSEWKDSTAGYDPSLSTFNGLFTQQPFHVNHGSSLQLGYNMLTKWRLLISY